MHVVRSTAVIARIFAKVQKLFDVHMPRFEIGTNSTFSFAALIHGNGRITDDLQKGNDSLALAVGPFDMRVGRSDIGPVIPQTTGPLGQFGIVGNQLENVIQIITNRTQVTGTQLWMQCARIK
jgi:hypothetical protein